MPRTHTTYSGKPTQAIIFLQMIAAHGNSDSCLEWPFIWASCEYGYVQYEGAQWRTHRLAWKLRRGRIYRDLDILHHCDNPPCFNYLHLFQGTNDDNVADMMSKGRQRNGVSIGEKHGNAKLTDDAVRSIRLRRQSGEPLPSIAADFGVTKQLIWNIVKLRGWKHVQ